MAAMTARFDDLAGRVAVVTGASRGIGAATARMFAANGMWVALVGRDEDALEQVREDIWDAGGRAVVAPADVTRPDALAFAAKHVANEFGDVDVLAAFAGGNGRPQPSESMGPPAWRAILDGDLSSAFYTIQTFVGGMLERGRGSIITMSSAAGRTPSQANVAYAVAKAGIVMLTRHLAAEFAPRGVRVNALAPSAVRNQKMAAMRGAQFDALAKSFPLGRIGEPNDIAAAAAYLASDASGWVTGVTLDISGGKVYA
jgi:3-oxoacyl-[acyl-carrier protein] reductase